MKLLQSRRIRVLLALLLLVLAGFCIAAYQVHFRWKWAVERYQRELRAAGEKLDLEQVLPRPVPLEQNGLPYLREASVSLSRRGVLSDNNLPHSMHLIAPGKALLGPAETELRGDKTNITWEQAEAEIAQFDDAFESLRQLIDHPVLDFGLDYRQGFALLLPHLAQMKGAAQRLNAAAMCDLHRGRIEPAALKIRTALAVANGMRDEPIIISQLVRIAIVALEVGPTWALLHTEGLTDPPLAQLQADWEKVDLVPSTQAALEMERAISELSIRQLREEGGDPRRLALFGMVGGGGPAGGNALAKAGEIALQETFWRSRAAAWRLFWSYPDEWRMLHGQQVLLDTFRRLRTGAPFGPTLEDQRIRLDQLQLPEKEEQGWMGGGDMDFRHLFSQSIRSVGNVPRRVLAANASTRLVVTALALKRCQLQQGDYPADLAALVPKFLSSPPRDPEDGAPLRYRKQAGGFLLYCIGDDAKDDGGDPTLPPSATWPKTGSGTFLKGRDWVWPQVASAAEEAEFYRTNSASRSR